MAVNLSGIELSGAAIGSAREVVPPSRKAASVQDASAPPTAEVNITSTAALLSRLGQALGTQPAIDQERVNILSKAVADGSYSVQPDKVAAGLIQSERSLAQLPFQR